MTSPSYAQNKIHQLAYQRNHRDITNQRRMISYFKNKSIFYREIYSFGKIHLSIFQ